jgi:hypothetical protein
LPEATAMLLATFPKGEGLGLCQLLLHFTNGYFIDTLKNPQSLSLRIFFYSDVIA